MLDVRVEAVQVIGEYGALLEALRILSVCHLFVTGDLAILDLAITIFNRQSQAPSNAGCYAAIAKSRLRQLKTLLVSHDL